MTDVTQFEGDMMEQVSAGLVAADHSAAITPRRAAGNLRFVRAFSTCRRLLNGWER